MFKAWATTLPEDARANPRQDVNVNCIKELVKVFQEKKK